VGAAIFYGSQEVEPMDEAAARALIEDHYAAAGKDEAHVGRIYAEDAILDFPQGGERIRGRANIVAFRSVYPARVGIAPRRITGSGDVWVIESTITYDGDPHPLVSIWEFRDSKLAHETSYVTDRWDPPAWRAQWVEPMPESEPVPR
jgi:ketosteroid isomerase-like protein